MDYTEFSGYEFEDYISRILNAHGFVVEQTAYSNDGGIDIIAIYEKPIFSGKYIIQCKNWQGNVGAPEVRDLYGVVMDQRANKGILITPSGFTEQAYSFAEGKNIELIDGVILKALSEILSNEKIETTKKQNVFPESFNKERYEYIRKQIKENVRVSKYYLEMKEFLLEYINNEQYLPVYSIISALIANTDELINKCYNAKTMITWKNTELRNKAVYCILAGKIEEALELILDRELLFRYSEEVLPFKKAPYLSISADYGQDCLTRNLYVVFNSIGYRNGLKIIDNCQKRTYNFSRCFTSMKHQEEDFLLEIEKCKRYINWNDNELIYIPEFHPVKQGKNLYICESVIAERCVSIEKVIKRETYNDKELFERLDLIFKKHGYEIL